MMRPPLSKWNKKAKQNSLLTVRESYMVSCVLWAKCSFYYRIWEKHGYSGETVVCLALNGAFIDMNLSLTALLSKVRSWHQLAYKTMFIEVTCCRSVNRFKPVLVTIHYHDNTIIVFCFFHMFVETFLSQPPLLISFS